MYGRTLPLQNVFLHFSYGSVAFSGCGLNPCICSLPQLLLAALWPVFWCRHLDHDLLVALGPFSLFIGFCE